VRPDLSAEYPGKLTARHRCIQLTGITAGYFLLTFRSNYPIFIQFTIFPSISIEQQEIPMNNRAIFAVFIISVSVYRLPGQSESLQQPENTGEIVYFIQTIDGFSLSGKVTEQDTCILIETRYGRLIIPRSQVLSMIAADEKKATPGKYEFSNPNYSRLLFSPTGHMLKKGQGYFADYYLFFPSVSYAITDHMTLNGGCSILPGVDLDKQIFYFAPKFGISTRNNWHFAAGGLFISLPDIDDENLPLIGVLYGVATYGNHDSGMTFGLGYGFVGHDFAENPVGLVGGEKRISRRLSLVTENLIIPFAGEEAGPFLLSYGLRFMSDKLSVDLSLISPTGEAWFFPGIPIVGFVFNF
jgi:hypothetical protein